MLSPLAFGGGRYIKTVSLLDLTAFVGSSKVLCQKQESSRDFLDVFGNLTVLR